MNTTKKMCGLFISTLFLFVLPAFGRNLLLGTIQFPLALESIPAVRVYRSGHKVECDIDNDAKKLSLSVPVNPRENTFYLLIVEKIEYAKAKNPLLAEHNTIDYLKVAAQQYYKFYKLKRIAEKQKDKINPGKTKKVFHWQIQEEKLPESGRVPDEAILVYYYPQFVDKLQGGSEFELPTLVMKSNITELAGSPDALQDISNQLLLSSLDHDALHARIKFEVKHNKQRTLVAPTA